MRTILIVAATMLASLSIANAQSSTPAKAGPSWSLVQTLPSGANIHVKAMQRSVNCVFKSASDTELTCFTSAPQTFARGEIKSVKLRHRGRSALAGLAIGIAGGAAVGAPLGRTGSIVGHGAAAVIIAIPGAVIGVTVGALTDFTHTTLYKAP